MKDIEIWFHSKSFRNLRLLTKITKIVFKLRSNSQENTYRSSSLWWMMCMVHISSKRNGGVWKETKWWQYPDESWNNGSNNKEVIKSVNGLIYSTGLAALALLWTELKPSSWDIITSELSPALNALFDDWVLS